MSVTAGTIALDLDGTLADYSHGWTGEGDIGDPLPGALDFVRALIADGYDLEVFSARAVDSPAAAAAIVGWLYRHGFPPLRVSTTKGSHYVAFVDDRAVAFRGDYTATRASLDALLAAPKWWAIDSTGREADHAAD